MLDNNIILIRYRFVNNLSLKSIDFFVKIGDIYDMEGLTITEIAQILKINPSAAKQRLIRAGITPITKEAIYDPSCVDRIREVSKGGRPRKNDKK
jgi:hypothetical protein